jgi:hypothetical protein
MSISSGAIYAVLLISPGFAFLWACFRKQDNAAGLALESPNSILALSTIGLGAILAHLIWVALCSANAAVVDQLGFGLAPLSDHTLYEIALGDADVLSNGDVAVAVLSSLALCWITFTATSGWASTSMGKRTLGPLRYGWADDLMNLSSMDGRFAAAFVLTSVEHDGHFVGYEGLLYSLNLDARREIASISLQDVGRFLVTVSDGKVERTPIDRKLIAYLHIERAQIKNVAFNVFELSRDAAVAELPPPPDPPTVDGSG